MDEMLIELVRDYEELYDTSTRKYSDSVFKEQLWNHIGEQLNKPGNTCKQRWASLRDQYRRYLRKITTKRGHEASSKTYHKYADQMAFVTPFLRENTATTIEDDLASVSDDEVTVVPLKKQRRSGGKAKDTSPNGETKAEREFTLALGETCSGLDSRREAKKASRPPSRRPLERPLETPSSPLKPLVTHTGDEEKNEEKPTDPIDLFFHSIAATVKTFTPYYQNVCKNKIFSVVSDLELTQILDRNSPSTATPGCTTAPATPHTTNTKTEPTP